MDRVARFLSVRPGRGRGLNQLQLDDKLNDAVARSQAKEVEILLGQGASPACVNDALETPLLRRVPTPSLRFCSRAMPLRGRVAIVMDRMFCTWPRPPTASA
jgi:hypothetical protein